MCRSPYSNLSNIGNPKRPKIDLVEEDYTDRMSAATAGIHANNLFAADLEKQKRDFECKMMLPESDMIKREMDLDRKEGVRCRKTEEISEKEKALASRASLLAVREATLQNSLENCIAAAIQTNCEQQLQVANRNSVQIHVGESGRVTTGLLAWLFVVSAAAFFVLLTASVSPSSVSPYNGRPAEAEPLKRATCLLCGLSTRVATIAGLFQSQLRRLVKQS